MTFLIALIFAGGSGVLNEGKGSAFAGEMVHFGGGNSSLGWGKWCIRVGEIGYLSKKILSKSIMGCRLVP